MLRCPGSSCVLRVCALFLFAVFLSVLPAPASAAEEPACGRLQDARFPLPFADFGRSSAKQITRADFDGDGVEDTLLRHGANAPHGTGYSLLTYEEGRPVRRLVAEVTYSSSWWADPPLVGDVNSDGRPDLVIVSHGRGSALTGIVSTFLNRPEGLFSPGERLLVSRPDRIWNAALGDFDGDGVAELAFDHSDLMRFYEYEAGTGWVVSGSAARLASDQEYRWSADLDGDGREELLLFDYSDAYHVIIRHGSAAAPLSHVDVAAVGFRGSRPFPFDGDGDGQDEMLISEYQGIGAEVLAHVMSWTAGCGVLTDEGAQVLPLHLRVDSIRDLDQDGDQDLLAGVEWINSGHAKTWQMMLNDGSGHLVAGPRGHGSEWPIDNRDLNGDGVLDLTIASALYREALSPRIVVFYGRREGGFDEGALFADAAEGGKLLTGDFDADGTLDLVGWRLRFQQWPHVDTLHIHLHRGLGGGRYGEPVEVSVPPETRLFTWDLDGDGFSDLAAVPEEYRDGALAIAWGNGDGTFLPWERTPLGARVEAIAQGPLDGSGAMLIVTVGESRQRPCRWLTPIIVEGRSVRVLTPMAFEDGAAANACNVSSPGPGITVADIDSDGRGDIVYALPEGDYHAPMSRLLARRGLPGGAFAAPEQIWQQPAREWVMALRAVDFDQDGAVDLESWSWSTVNLLEGDGKGQFLRVWHEEETSGDWFWPLADIDLDGNRDLVGWDDGAIHRFGLGDGAFAEPIRSGTNGPGTAWGDFLGTGGVQSVSLRAVADRAYFVIVPVEGHIAAVDVEAPKLELSLIPALLKEEKPVLFEGRWRVAVQLSDDCDTLPQVKRARILWEAPLLGDTLFVEADRFEVRVHHEMNNGLEMIVLAGPDELAARSLLAEAIAQGGFPTERGAMPELSVSRTWRPVTSHDLDGDLLPPGDWRLAERWQLREGLVDRAAIDRPEGDLVVEIVATDRSGRSTRREASWWASRERYCADPVAPDVVCD